MLFGVQCTEELFSDWDGWERTFGMGITKVRFCSLRDGNLIDKAVRRSKPRVMPINFDTIGDEFLYQHGQLSALISIEETMRAKTSIAFLMRKVEFGNGPKEAVMPHPRPQAGTSANPVKAKPLLGWLRKALTGLYNLCPAKSMAMGEDAPAGAPDKDARHHQAALQIPHQTSKRRK